MKNSGYKYRSASKGDLAQVESILKRLGLPYEDCSEHFDNFLIVEDSNEIVGTGGLELYGEVALLRSIVVLEEYRGKNIGDKIFGNIKANALSLGVKEIYLLTETAEKYFKARHFSEIDRNFVPKEIRQTKQFSSLCPSSALVMRYVF